MFGVIILFRTLGMLLVDLRKIIELAKAVKE